jgi:DNA-binding NarL/FixJ family response regulator
MTAIRVLIADDHPVFRRGLRALIDTLAGIEVVGEAADGETAVTLAAQLLPDVVVMDLNMPVLNGVEATRRIAAYPSIAVLVLTMLDEEEQVFAAMRAGARGYIVKGADTDDVLRALESVARGDVIFGPAIAGRVLSYLTRPLSARDPVLFPEHGRLRENSVSIFVSRYGGEQALARCHVDEAAVVPLEGDCHRRGRPVPVLGNDQVRLARARRLPFICIFSM